MSKAQYDYYWLLPDGRIWSSVAAGWVILDDVPFDPEYPDVKMLVKLRDLEHLRDNLRFYSCEMGELADINDLQDQLDIIDLKTSEAITTGFDYKLDNFDLYHFSYDLIDQQNFADAANIATLKKLGLPGLPDTVDWNAWTIKKDSEDNVISKEMTRISLTPELLFELYGAAITHKNTQITLGSKRKQELLDSISK